MLLKWTWPIYYKFLLSPNLPSIKVFIFFCYIFYLLALHASSYITLWAGWVVSSTLAGATVGSFTGGALADKFGRTRTFQLDAIPLAVGAFLWLVMRLSKCEAVKVGFTCLQGLISNWLEDCCSATSQSVQTMIIGRVLAGIGIGISSAIVPLYISEVVTFRI